MRRCSLKCPAQIILRPVRFLAISFYLYALAIGAMVIEPVKIWSVIFICIYKNTN
jgi:hypothetical protein